MTGESSFIRERARTLGMTMQELADRVGVSYSYVTQVARGRQSMGVKVQAQDRVGVAGPGEGCARHSAPTARACVVSGGEQLHQGAGPGSWA